MGTVRVAIFFLVHAFGITTQLGSTFSHLRDKADAGWRIAAHCEDRAVLRLKFLHDRVQLLSLENIGLPTAARLRHDILCFFHAEEANGLTAGAGGTPTWQA